MDLEEKVCSVCKEELSYDFGVNYEDQTTGALFCEACKRDGCLQLNPRESRDAGIFRAMTFMRVSSSMPNRRAPGLPSSEKEKKK